MRDSFCFIVCSTEFVDEGFKIYCTHKVGQSLSVYTLESEHSDNTIPNCWTNTVYRPGKLDNVVLLMVFSNTNKNEESLHEQKIFY